jgi:RHS repeat-associated protein
MSGASLGFNGELRDWVLHAYALGNGHRFYSPIMMRFCSADSLSPFGKGGLNAYCYCEGDPINRSDPSGRAGTGLKGEFTRLNIPQVFRAGVKTYFKKNPTKTAYHLGIGEAGYLIEKSPAGRFTAAPISGLGATHELLKQSQTDNLALQSENSGLIQSNEALMHKVRMLEQQLRRNKPEPPPSPAPPRLPPPPSRRPPPLPPRTGHLALNQAHIRQL